MLPSLWEDAFSLVCTSIAPDDQGERDTRCGGSLYQRDDITLVCSNLDCRTEYHVRDGVPALISHDSAVPIAEYDDELLAQMYAEMNFASFDTAPRPAAVPLPATNDPDILARRLFASEDLTGPFYSTIADIVMEHAPPTPNLVADIACGMARLAFELDSHGWSGRYLGIDLSRRLLSDAQRAFSGEEILVRMGADLGRHPQSRAVLIQAPKLDPERSLLAVGDADRLPMAARSCDAVVALNLVDRVADPVKTVRELWRCVAPGGILVLADPFQWQNQSPDRRFYSFDAVSSWLDDAVEVELRPEHRSVLFPIRRRDSREIVIHDDAVAVLRRRA